MAQKDPLTDDHRQKEHTVYNLPTGIVSLLAKQSFADLHIFTLATCYGVPFCYH